MLVLGVWTRIFFLPPYFQGFEQTRDQGLHKPGASKQQGISELDSNTSKREGGGYIFESDHFPSSVHAVEFESELDSNRGRGEFESNHFPASVHLREFEWEVDSNIYLPPFESRPGGGGKYCTLTPDAISPKGQFSLAGCAVKKAGHVCHRQGSRVMNAT